MTYGEGPRIVGVLTRGKVYFHDRLMLSVSNEELGLHDCQRDWCDWCVVACVFHAH